MPQIIGVAILTFMQAAVPMQPNCTGPVTQAELGRLFQANLKEDDIVRHLVACGLGTDLTSKSEVLAQVEASKGFQGTIEWLHKWESMGTRDAEREKAIQLEVTGSWTATFSDSKMNGTLHVSLSQTPRGVVRGTYSSSIGGGGQVFGTVWAKEAKVELRQNVEGCPGLYKSTLRREGESLVGEYVGYDCTGAHLDGRFTLTPGIVLPSSSEANKVNLVFGSDLELRTATTVHIMAPPANIYEKEAIEFVLRSEDIPLQDSLLKADVLVVYGVLDGKPHVAAAKPVMEHNTLRIIWFCSEYPENLSTIRIAEYCARQFASAYAEHHAK